MNYREEAEHKNPTEMRNSIAPNFVHSMDASHLMETVRLCLLNALGDFAVIHDSFGTHAARSGEFAQLIREAFILLYDDDILASFVTQLKEQLPPNLAKELPEPPPRGDFDITEVRESEFFFS
jgi:DNA-directed RNA polymerase